MADHTLFIANVLLLAGLIAGASYVQTHYDTDKSHSVVSTVSPTSASASAVVTPANTTGWQVSTSKPEAVANTNPAPSVQVQAPVRRRVYNEERDDDN